MCKLNLYETYLSISSWQCFTQRVKGEAVGIEVLHEVTSSHQSCHGLHTPVLSHFIG